MTDELKLKVVEALQEEAYKGIIRIDSQTMKKLNVRPGEIIEIEGERKTVGIVERAYPTDIGQSLIRMDGIIRRNAKTGIGELVKVRKAEIKEAKAITIAPAQKGIMIQAHPDVFKKGLLGRAVIKGDVLSLGGTRSRRRIMSDSPFQDIFDMFEHGMMDPFGLSDLRFIVVETNPKQPVIITEETRIEVSPQAVDVKEEQRIPEVSYEDIGGLDEEIKKVREMVELPLKHPEIFERLGVQPPKGILMYGPPGTGKTLLAKAVASESDANFILVNGPEVTNKFYGETEKRIRDIFEQAEKNAPSIVFIDEVDAMAPKREETYGEVERRMVSQLLTCMDGLKSRGKVVVIAATNRPNDIDPALRRPGRFDRELQIGVPNKAGRLQVLKVHTRNMPLTKDVDIDYLASITHGFVGADISALCKEAAMNVLRKILPDLNLKEDHEIPKEILEKLVVKHEDFMAALKFVRPSAMREVLVEKPNVKWEDVGGLEYLKQELKEAIEWPLKNPEAFKRLGIKAPKGILIYGPPGTGKTLLAKAVASEAEANFISVKGPELLSKWVGDSEKGVRKVFERARQTAPTIVFFDEIDAIAGSRGRFSGDSGVTEKVVNALLSEMDGLEELKDVVVIAASVIGDTPILIKEKGEVKLIKIASFVDKYYKENEGNIEKPVEGIETLGFEKINGKKIKGLRFKNSAFKRIRSVFRHKVNEIYEIEFIGGKIKTTGNHSVFIRTKRGLEYKLVSKLKEGEYLVDLPYKVKTNEKHEKLRSHDFINNFDLVLPVYEFDQQLQQDYGSSLVSNLSQHQIAAQIGVSQSTVSNWQTKKFIPRELSLAYFKHRLPDYVNVTPDLMRLLGYYLAEGYARKEIDFCFNINEINYIDDVQSLMKNIFGIIPNRILNKTKNAINITYNSKPLAKFFIKYCGKGAKNKHIPQFLFEVPREYFLEFLRGYIAGDGHITKEESIEITSVSKQVIIELNWLCRMHGIKTSRSKFTTKAGRKIHEQIINTSSVAYRLLIPGCNNPFKQEETRSLSRRAKIKSIKKIPYDGYVYDLCGCENEAFFGGETPILLHNTNRPDLIDPGLLRPGRFDRIIFTPVPDKNSRESIFKIHTKKMPLAKDVDIKKLVEKTDNCSGADIEGICREAGLLALREDIKTKEIKMKHFEKALEKIKPSITDKELKKYKQIEEEYLKVGRGVALERPNYLG